MFIFFRVKIQTSSNQSLPLGLVSLPAPTTLPQPLCLCPLHPPLSSHFTPWRPKCSKTVQLGSLQYVVYTDAGLVQSRTTFFEKQHAGHEGGYTLSKELRFRLIRNTVTSLIAIKRAAGDDFQYPCSRELTVMAKCLIEYYSMTG